MCGFYFSTKYFEESVVKNKMARIAFRGPDASGIIQLEDNITLAHNRLAIIDLDQRSNQPFRYNHLWIVFNGEIYNYGEIKKDLQKNGYTFRTTSDTEVICAAYLHYGTGCLQHFNGMFSFVIYDEYRKKVFAARDRLGKKPFFYRIYNGELECASQPSQIAIGNKLAVNTDMISYLLANRYIPTPYTIYKDVFKLPAGGFFYYSPGSREVQVEKYWDLNYSNQLSYKGSYSDAMNELRLLLSDAINIRMISDVPVGTFLSGGIDSSLITAMLCQQQKGAAVRTFSVRFDQEKFDESVYATAIARHLGTCHTNIECDFNEGLNLIEQLPEYYDEPFADSSAIPSMLLAKATRRYVTVALSGDGGDEGFLGYNYFDVIDGSTKLFYIPYFLRYLVGVSLKHSTHNRLKQAGIYLRYPNADMFVRGIFEKRMWGGVTNLPGWQNSDLDKITSLRYNILQKAADINIKLWLENDSNVKVDRAAMSSSLEVRSPFLDYRVIEFSRKLPVSYRYNHGEKKRILKDLLYRYVPRELLDRPKKGFTMPFEEWFRTDLRSYVYEKLSANNLKAIPDLDLKYIYDNVELHMERKRNFYPTIWSLIVFINWLEYNKISL